MIKEFFKYQRKKAFRYFKENKAARILVAILMLVVVALIAWGVFYASKKGLEFTQIEEDVFMSKIAPLYIYEVFLLITGFLIFISSAIFGLVNFFKAQKDAWIMASPKYSKMLWVNSLKAINSSTWAIVIISIPLLIATGQVFQFSFLASFLSIIAVLIFSVVCSLSALILIMVFSLLMKLVSLKSFKILAILMSSVVTFMAVFSWRKVIYMNLDQVFQIDNIINPSVKIFSNYFSIFPSHFPAMTIFSFQEGSTVLAFKYLTILSLALLFLILVVKLLESKFLYVWQIFQEGSFEAKKEEKKPNKHLLENSFPKTAEGVIYKKELLTSLRSSKNLLWFSFLAVLLFAQVGVITLLDKYSNIGDGFILGDSMIAVQLVIVLFFVTAFIVRFVFPSFSQESNTSWIIGSAPIKMSKIFLTKYKLFSIVLSILGVSSLFLYIVPLDLEFPLAIVLSLMTLIAILTLTMIGLSLGVIYINFESNDPNELSTSAGGIIFMVSALTYIALGVYLFYLNISTLGYLPLIIFVVISAVVYLLFKRKALKSLDNIEFH